MSADNRGFSDPLANEHSKSTSQAPPDRVEELAWMLVDDNLSEQDRRELEALLSKNAEARQTYVDCVRLHCDLVEHFAGREVPAVEPTSSAQRSPVLGFLQSGIGMPGLSPEESAH